MKILFKYFLVVSVAVGFCVEGLAQPTTWFKTYPITGRFLKVVQTYDDNYIGVGSFFNEKILLVKVNAYGDTLWTRKIGNESYNQRGSWIENTLDNGNIISGGTSEGINSDAYVVKTDLNGFLIWDNLYGNNNLNNGNCIKPTLDSGYIFLMRNSYVVGSSIMVVKINNKGDIIWENDINLGYTENIAREIDLIENGYIFTGYTAIVDQKSFLCLVRLDQNGDTIWTKKYNNDIQLGTEGWGVQKVSTGGFIILGRTRTTQNQVASYVIKTDSLGNMEWDRIYLSGFRGEYSHSIREIPGKGYVFCGANYMIYPDTANGFVRVIDYDGNVMHEKPHRLPGYDWTWFYSVEVTSDGGFIICGENAYPLQVAQILFVKTDSEGNIVSVNQVSSIIPENFILHQNYPNPFNPKTSIKYEIPLVSNVTLKVFDIIGREVMVLLNAKQDPGTYIVNWNADGFSSGIYLYQLFVKDQNDKEIHSSSRRMVYLK
jgi:hypothetical protein